MRKPICNSQTARDSDIDGHALCYFWDFCQSRIDGSRPPCFDDLRIRESIEQQLRWHIARGACDSLEQIETER